MSQPFLSYEVQINKLNIKGLTIPDIIYAKKKLHEIGYYALISGYKDLYIDKSSDKYKRGTMFDDIVSLYDYDGALREIFLKYIIKIEKHIRSILSYYFTEIYSEKQEYYLNKNNYNMNASNEEGILKLINRLDSLAKKNKEHAFINYNRKKYNNVPLWALVHTLTFGELSKFYLYTLPNIQTKVSKEFYGLTEGDISNLLYIMTIYRNICAHGERLYSYKTQNAINDFPIHKKLNIAMIGTEYIYGKHDLFAEVISFKYLLSVSDFEKFIDDLKITIELFIKNSKLITQESLLDQMHFPRNWYDIKLIKLNQ